MGEGSGQSLGTPQQGEKKDVEQNATTRGKKGWVRNKMEDCEVGGGFQDNLESQIENEVTHAQSLRCKLERPSPN